MLARVYSCAVIGLDGVVVEMEVDTTQGMPGMTIVRLPDAPVQESRERVQAAVRNAGVPFPRRRLVVNLVPASVRKESPSYDLPIALGVLIYAGMLPPQAAEGWLVVGELSLDGSVRHTCGGLPMAATAQSAGFESLVVPQVDAAEAALIPDLQVLPVASMVGLCRHLTGREPITPQPSTKAEDAPLMVPGRFTRGQGPGARQARPGGGRGRRSQRTDDRPAEGGQDAAGARPARHPAEDVDRRGAGRDAHLLGRQPAASVHAHDQPRPFRSPHYTISHAGQVGGGNWPHPGEISLAHHGVLFLDELPEFGMRALEVLRQPLEDKVVTISRAQGSLTFPASIQMAAAMNPC